MPGMLGVFGIYHRDFSKPFLIDTINLNSTDIVKRIDYESGFFAVSSLKKSILIGAKYFENSQYLACFSGDLIDNQEVPWESIIHHFHNKNYKIFSDFRGNFSFAILDKRNESISLVSDRSSQQPIYYLIANETFIFSTSISTFCRLPGQVEFNIDWLYELLFFNYPIGQTTFLNNVKRMPPGSILKYNLRSCNFSFFEYTPFYTIKKNLFKGKEAIDKAFTVFEERVPKYFGTNTPVACSLSGGLDSRTLLSFVPSEAPKKILTFTYGVPGCYDLEESSKISDALSLSHTKVYLDDSFTKELPRLLYDTVYFSNGLQGVNRSTLYYIYKTLNNMEQYFPIFLSGVSGDDLFRNHISSHHYTISSDILQIFRTGKRFINRKFYEKIYDANLINFEDHINATLDKMEVKYGKFGSVEAYLYYILYEVTPKYFGGEASIANNFSTFRAPYWDADIIQLSTEIEYSTAGFFRTPKKDRYREKIIQANLIQRNSNFDKVPIEGIPLKLYKKNNKLHYNIYRLATKGPQKIRSKLIGAPSYSKPENWTDWYKTPLNLEIDKLISKKSLILEYLNWEFLKEIKDKKNVYWLGKILTTEIILNLIKNGWKK